MKEVTDLSVGSWLSPHGFLIELVAEIREAMYLHKRVQIPRRLVNHACLAQTQS